MITLIRIVVMLILLPIISHSAGIVTRTATRDSLSIPFAPLDSAGNSIDLVSGDSVYITVFSPGGTVVFKDSMAFNDASIVSYNWEDFSGGQHYAYVERVSVLDGPSTAEGVFSYILAVDDNTGADLITTYTGQFQIINTTLESALDSAGLAAVNSSQALDSLGLVLDSLYAVIDSLQNQDNWVAQQVEVANINGWTPILDNDSLIIDQSSLEDIIVAGVTNTVSISGEANHRIADSVWAHIDSAWAPNTMGSQLRDSVKADLNAIRDSLQFLITASGFSIHTVDDIWEYDSANVSGDQAMGSMLKDTSAYQGSAAGITEAGVADAVWDELQSAHTIAGSFGKYIDAEISGVSSGSGAFAYTIVTFDSANIQPVGGVALTVRNIDQTGLVAVGLSDVNGNESFNLDANSFVVVATAPGFLFTPFDSIVVTGAGVDTVFGYTFNPGTPAPGLCRVFGYLLTISGAGEANAEVSAHLPKGVSRTGNAIVSPFSVATATDATGYWAIDVVPSPLLNPTTSMYEFLITRSDGTILRKRVTVPNQSSWQLTW